MTSMLYSLPPAGVGTSGIESLTSYITRLSSEHCVKPGDLIADILAPVIGKKYIVRGARKSYDPFYKVSYKINGVGQEARDFVLALENLTGVINFKLLTMLPFSLLPAKGLLKSHQAWCPLCIEEWSENGYVIYSPLLWSIAPVASCMVHDCLLQERCPGCKNTIPFLTRQSINGYCPICGLWLGSKTENCGESQPSDYERWVTRIIGSMLLLTQDSDQVIQEKNIRNNLITILQSPCATPGFNNYLSISKTTLYGWQHGETIPTLSFLLRLCFACGFDLQDILCKCISKDQCRFSATKKLPAISPQARSKSKVNLKVISGQLSNLLGESTRFLSIEEAARELGVSSKTIRKYFPDEAKRLSEQYLNFQREQAGVKIENDLIVVRKVISEILNGNIYPSRELVESRCEKPFILRHEKTHKYWLDVISAWNKR